MPSLRACGPHAPTLRQLCRDAVPTLPDWKSPHVSTEDFGELRLRFSLFESLLKASA